MTVLTYQVSAMDVKKIFNVLLMDIKVAHVTYYIWNRLQTPSVVKFKAEPKKNETKWTGEKTAPNGSCYSMMASFQNKRFLIEINCK